METDSIHADPLAAFATPNAREAFYISRTLVNAAFFFSVALAVFFNETWLAALYVGTVAAVFWATYATLYGSKKTASIRTKRGHANLR